MQVQLKDDTKSAEAAKLTAEFAAKVYISVSFVTPSFYFFFVLSFSHSTSEKKIIKKTKAEVASEGSCEK